MGINGSLSDESDLKRLVKKPLRQDCCLEAGYDDAQTDAPGSSCRDDALLLRRKLAVKSNGGGHRVRQCNCSTFVAADEETHKRRCILAPLLFYIAQYTIRRMTLFINSHSLSAETFCPRDRVSGARGD